ncbi:hypothetical protein GBA65_20260 [Rubrobacter marinus]|uniref:NOMO second beta-sandwich domain-containing protein n=1 Tax=Rubrobacter marinus TaxID=2653852 RepID=A0A6G8Q1V8_9ACTN|nr:carboxypeptidase-like regulatory domain-containing protein [Rubrobacter marinus]QIN80462.1 hypothetical protein GBA65_20260 [Rubrobacter marinus]
MTQPRKIAFDRLADWVEGRLPEEEARVVEEQMRDADEETLAEVEWLRAFARVSEGTVFDSPPPEVREKLERRFEAFAEGRRPNLFRRLVAKLSFEGGVQPAFGVRSAGAQETQGQFTYTTDAADVVLNVLRRPRDGRLDLDGQVFPAGEAEPATFSVQLLSGEREAGITTTDELGEFVFESVVPGEYEILVSGERVEIQIPAVELRL